MMQFLLAVDLGIKTGLAFYSSEGELLWYRSQNFGNKSRLRKAIPWILSLEKEIDYLVIEGGGPLKKIWVHHLENRNIEVRHIVAEDWRREVLLFREQRNKKLAKNHALVYAQKVIQNISSQKNTSLNYDAAEAILIGLWGIHQLNWIKNIHTVLK